jgi:hypothetical protein
MAWTQSTLVSVSACRRPQRGFIYPSITEADIGHVIEAVRDVAQEHATDETPV